MPVVDEPRPGEPLKRARGRHAAPSAAPAASWISRVTTATAQMRARTSPRLAAAAAWLRERRVHVLVIGSGVATAALIGGSVAMLQLSAPVHDEEASVPVVLPTSRPTSTDPASPNAFGHILPSPSPSPSPAPPVAPSTQAPVESPADETLEPPVDDAPAPEPAPEFNEPRRETAPGATNRPDKPRD